MYNDQLVYKVVIWAFLGISLWKEKVALIDCSKSVIKIVQAGHQQGKTNLKLKDRPEDAHTLFQNIHLEYFKLNLSTLFSIFLHKIMKLIGYAVLDQLSSLPRVLTIDQLSSLPRVLTIDQLSSLPRVLSFNHFVMNYPSTWITIMYSKYNYHVYGMAMCASDIFLS